MALKDRIVEIAYKLRDDFSSRVSGVTGSFKKVDAAAEKSAKKVGLLGGAFQRAGKSAKIASLAIKATLVGALLSVTAAIGSAIAGMGKFRRELDASAKAARSLGETTQNITALKFAAELSGLATQQLLKGLQQMVRVSSEAAQGIGRSAEAINELGLDAAQLEKLNPTQQLKQIAEAMGDIQNQSDKVRIAEAIFGARGATGFLNLLEKGADGIKRMTDAARETGNVFTDAEAAKVENYNDKLATLDNTISGLTKRWKLFYVDFQLQAFDSFGLISDKGKTDLELVDKRITAIIARTQELKNSGSGFRLFGPSVQDELKQLQKEYENLIQGRENLLSGNRIRQLEAQDRAAERAHNREMATIRKEGTDALKKTLNERRKAYQKNLVDLQRIRNEEKQIADEFAGFVSEIQSSGGAGKTPDLIDASKAKLDAQTALNAGNFDEAIKKARQAADMVREMKDAGAESNIVLTGLAKMIQDIANKSAQGKTKAKEGVIAEQKKQIDEVAKAIENLPKAKITVDEDSLRAELARVQGILDAKPLVIKTRTESVASFGNQSDLERQIDEAARQRGTR